jgi:hypothetical protein
MKKRSIAILLFILFVTGGCIKIERGAFDGGVYKSVDEMERWRQKSVFLSLPQENNILDNVEVTELCFDPQDTGTIYLGTRRDGLFVSFDAAESWEGVEDCQMEKSMLSPLTPRPNTLFMSPLREKYLEQGTLIELGKMFI